MKKLHFIFCLLISSCTFRGEDKSEMGIVIGKSYTPSSCSIETGVSTGGQVVTTTSSTPETYCVIFRCFDHHKTFVIERQDLYEKLFEKDTVIITYCNEYRKHDSSFYDFGFIDANRK